MKKLLAVLLIFGSVSAALSAQMQLSAGLGGNFAAGFSSVVLSKEAKDGNLKPEDFHSHLLGGGFYAFFDATYVEADIGLFFAGYAKDKNPDKDISATITTLKLGLFGKYPIALGGGVSFFPMLGIDGQIFLGGKYKYDGRESNIDNDDSKKLAREMFNEFWFKGGVGFDIPFAEQFYFRAEALYGFRLNTQAEQDRLLRKTETTEYDEKGDKHTVTSPALASAVVGHGLDIRLSIGYKF